LAGANNAGKSNFLRALNAFFSGDIEPGVPLDIDKHYWRPQLRQKKRKAIIVSVEFSLPSQFKFRKGLEGVRDMLGDRFVLSKCWTRDYSAPIYALTSSTSIEQVDFDRLEALDLESERKVDSFLSLISFRYIPNRVIPTDLIRKEHLALRDVLVRRLAKHKKSQDALFRGIQETAKALISKVSEQVTSITPNVSGVRLDTASSLAELVFRFGYLIREGSEEMNEDEQGSGLQSLLMFQTLHMIDLDYFQQFGWKQASVWVVEEPESSLHTSLEARIARFLSLASREPQGRLQTIATTHSDLVIQYADRGYLVEKTARPESSGSFQTTVKRVETRQLVTDASKAGISRWVNPILYFPLSPVILVEGKYDRDFLASAQLRVEGLEQAKILCLEDLTGRPHDGGVERLLDFVRANRDAIGSRLASAPVVILLDWDSSNKKGEFLKAVPQKAPFHVLAWNADHANPRLNKTFGGIERFLSDRVVDEAAKIAPSSLGQIKGGGLTAVRDEYQSFKAACNKIVRAGVMDDDLAYTQTIAEELRAILAAV